MDQRVTHLLFMEQSRLPLLFQRREKGRAGDHKDRTA